VHNLDSEVKLIGSESSSSNTAQKSSGPKPSSAPEFVTLQRRSWMIADMLRGLLILLSLVVAAGFILILLPQRSVDELAAGIQNRRQSSQPVAIAFLYLGDKIEGNEFRIRGAVRNITTEPIEKLDAVIRLYSHDGSLIETAVVRMNKEIIAPDEIAQFDLVYPDYKSQFASYSVEFKLRQGDFVPYKDMRGADVESD
jgi:hypothetical protein